jgi:hypothetical protein
MAAEVGSDVPFCIAGGSAVATGRGDKIREVPGKGSTWWVVGIDHERLATQDVYDRFDELGLATPLEAAGPTTCWPPWPPATSGGSGWPSTTTWSRPPSTCSPAWPGPSSGCSRPASSGRS